MRTVAAGLAGLTMGFFFSSAALAETAVPLGVANLGLKVGYIKFTDNQFSWTENFDENRTATTLDFSSGLYVGLEGYYNVWEDLYLGLEIGYTKNEDDIADTLNQNSATAHPSNRNATYHEFSMGMEYIPIQVNAKYCIEPIEDLALGFGAGLSYNRAEISFDYNVAGTTFGDITENNSVNQWLWGGQIFLDAVYKINAFFIGLNATYQITEDWAAIDDSDSVNFNNYRISAMLGYQF